MNARGLSGLLALLLAVSTATAREPFVFGVSTHQATEQGLEMMARAGVQSVREDIRWQWVEIEKGKLEMAADYERYVSAALARGLSPLLILDYGNPHYDEGDFPGSPEAIAGFVRFCEFVVQHFRGRVFRYEIWNEWNVGTDMGSPGGAENYVKLISAVYPALKKLAPEVTILGGSMSGNGLRNDWIIDACRAGLLEHLDALSFHPYCWGAEGEERQPDRGLVKRVRDLEETIARFPRGRTVPFYITELGWPTHRGESSSTEDEAAAFLARSVLQLRAMPRVRGVWWYTWRDDGDDDMNAQLRFGAVRGDLSPKPAFAAVGEVTRFLHEARGPFRIRATANTRSIVTRDRRGRTLAAAWTLQDPETLRLYAPRAVAGQSVLQRRSDAAPVPRSWDTRGARAMLRVTIGPQPTFLFPGR